MFTKVHQKLAKSVYEAIPKIARKAGKKCPKCRGLGKFPLSKERIVVAPRYTHIKCPICNGTGKVKGKWEWKPERYDHFILPTKLMQYGVVWSFDEKTAKLTYLGDALDQADIRDCICASEYKYAIPLLHWERIEEILEGMGWSRFEFSFWINGRVETCSRKTMSKPDTSDWKMLCSATGKDRQEAVQKAILALVEQLEEKQ